ATVPGRFGEHNHSDDDMASRTRIPLRKKSTDSNLAFPRRDGGYSSDSSIYSTSAASAASNNGGGGGGGGGFSFMGFGRNRKGKGRAHRVASRDSITSSLGFGGDSSTESTSDGNGGRMRRRKVRRRESSDSQLAFGS